MNTLSSLFFGTQQTGPAAPEVKAGNRAIDVTVEGQTLRVDVDALADVSGLFLQVQSQEESECSLEDFPGGFAAFRQMVNVITSPKEQGTIPVTEGNVLQLFEAAWLLECPRIFDEIMASPYMRSLSSRRKVELLETLLPFTSASNPIEGFVQERSVNDDLVSIDEFMRTFLLETKMWQRSERAAIELCSQLDANDFVLGPRLATGSLRVSCEILRLHQKRDEEAGFVSSALLPVTALWKNLTDKPLKAKVSWDAHLFALHCMRKRLVSSQDSDPSGAQAMPVEHQEDAQAKADIPGDVCDSVEDSKLLSVAELVSYVDVQRAPPNWACLIVRALLLSGRTVQARWAFGETFPSGPKVQQLAWKKPTAVPVVWLSDVADHLEAARGLLRVLSSFRDMDANELCDIVEDVLLEQFLPLKHCAPVVLASELVNDIVGACFEAGLKAQLPRKDGQVDALAGNIYTNGDSSGSRVEGDAKDHAVGERQTRCPSHWEGQHVLWRLHHVGIRLFKAAFVAQCGFLPHTWPDCLGEAEPATSDGVQQEIKQPVTPSTRLSSKEEMLRCQEEPACQLEPLVIKVSGECLWDEELLKLELLNPVMDLGRACPSEPILHFGRQVIMRHLWYGYRGIYCDIKKLAVLWELACWPLCEDATLIREALEYLKGTYRELHACGGSWSPEFEDIVFKMFAALDLSRLPGQALLSPWVPPQVQMVRLLVQQQPAEQFHAELQHEVASASESLKSINQQCSRLSNKLNIVEQRTVINKSQISDAIVVIEEHQRRRTEAALPRPRRETAK